MPDIVLSELTKNGITGILIGAMLVYVWYSETRKFPKMLDTFKAELATERAVCTKNHEEVMLQIRTEGNANREMHQQTRHSMANIVNAANLKRHMEKHKPQDPQDEG